MSKTARITHRERSRVDDVRGRRLKLPGNPSSLVLLALLLGCRCSRTESQPVNAALDTASKPTPARTSREPSVADASADVRDALTSLKVRATWRIYRKGAVTRANGAVTYPVSLTIGNGEAPSVYKTELTGSLAEYEQVPCRPSYKASPSAESFVVLLGWDIPLALEAYEAIELRRSDAGVRSIWWSEVALSPGLCPDFKCPRRERRIASKPIPNDASLDMHFVVVDPDGTERSPHCND
jgi:hypothetical protein